MIRDVVIIGGGLAGLTSSILLKRAGLDVSLIERKSYPFHRVCGEYISNEVLDFLSRENLLPEMDFPRISRFGLSSISGSMSYSDLSLGGFGISRYALDFHLYQLASNEGVNVQKGAVSGIEFINDQFEITVDDEIFLSKICIGAFGKRSNLDNAMNRSFFQKRSPYVGVKYHARTEHPSDLVALHNFSKGYCGISRVEDEKTNICYLTHRSNLKKYGNIPEMEEEVLFRNPRLKEIFESAEFLWEKPEVINEITFEQKSLIENHVLMCGDSAGMITPLCGNGMAMAIHSAKMLSEEVVRYFSKSRNREALEQAYENKWNKEFKSRLQYGRRVQRLFGSPLLSNFSVNLINSVKPLARNIIRRTHGSPI